MRHRYRAHLAYATYRVEALDEFLTNEQYRKNLLVRPATVTNQAAYRRSKRIFGPGFGANFGSSVQAITNRMTVFLNDDFLEPMLCAPRNTINLDNLWKEQSAVFVVLSEGSEGSGGKEGVKRLGGLFVQQLYLACQRAKGDVPVVLCLDEAGVKNEFVRDAITEISVFAREQKLRLLVACQYLSQLKEAKEAMDNARVKVFMHPTPPDAKELSGLLADAEAAADPSVVQSRRVRMSPKSKYSAHSRVSLVVTDANGSRFYVDPIWEASKRLTLRKYGRHSRIGDSPYHPDRGKPPLAGFAPDLPGFDPETDYRSSFPDGCRGIPLYHPEIDVCRPLCVRPGGIKLPWEGRVPLRDFMAAVPRCSFQCETQTSYNIEKLGEERHYYQLHVDIPDPEIKDDVRPVSDAERSAAWKRCLLSLPRQHGVLSVATQKPVPFRAADFHIELVERLEFGAFLDPEEAATTADRRLDEIDRIASGLSLEPAQDADEGGEPSIDGLYAPADDGSL